MPADLRADTTFNSGTTTFNSGTTTVSSGTDFGGNLFVGTTGTATLEVIAGGNAINTDGYLGYLPGGVGTATVTSGTWATSELLFVGYEGSGTLNVAGGGVTSQFSLLGFNVGSVGTATVTSGMWATSEWLFVGISGSGTLIVNGGSVTSAYGDIGSSINSVGTVTVTSGTWTNSGDLVVGTDGNATLTMTGGRVIVGGTLASGGLGTINLHGGGTLQIGVGGTTGALGVAALTNNGTLIFNRSDADTYAGVVSGTGGIVKQGTGSLAFAGANSYSGVTTISDGTLALSGTGSIGTGGVNLGTTASPGAFDLAALMSGTYVLPATGDLTGVGTLAGDGKSLAVLGSFLPGNSPGTVTVGAGFTLDLSQSGTTVFEITSPLFTAGSFDLVNGDGSVIFGGTLRLDFSGGTYAKGTDVLQIFANTGGRFGDFTSVVATGLDSGQYAAFNPATGSILIVPEPSTWAMALAGLVCGGFSMWRRRR